MTSPQDYAGRYYSDEAEVMYEVLSAKDALVVKRRPGIETRLRPTGKDEFAMGGSTLRFIRAAGGEVTGFALRGSRVFDLRFVKSVGGGGGSGVLNTEERR